MVQGTRTRQNASENIAAAKKPLVRLAQRGTLVSRSLFTSAQMTIVEPMAAANKPLSGRKSTAVPAVRPVKVHKSRARFLLVDWKANVASRHMVTARKLVITSVRIVLT